MVTSERWNDDYFPLTVLFLDSSLIFYDELILHYMREKKKKAKTDTGKEKKSKLKCYTCKSTACINSSTPGITTHHGRRLLPFSSDATEVQRSGDRNGDQLGATAGVTSRPRCSPSPCRLLAGGVCVRVCSHTLTGVCLRSGSTSLWRSRLGSVSSHWAC